MEEPVLMNRWRMDAVGLKNTFSLVTRTTRVIQLAAAAVMLGLAVFLTCRGEVDLLTFLLYAGAGAYVFLAIRQPAKLTAMQLRRITENYGTDSVDTQVAFCPEEYRCCREGAEEGTHAPYENIVSIQTAEGIILLRTAAKQFVSLDPTRFENGTEADFWRLMNEKCPKAVPKAYRTPGKE